jgi:hypothetical protein
MLTSFISNPKIPIFLLNHLLFQKLKLLTLLSRVRSDSTWTILIKMGVNDEDKVQTQYICSNTMLNHLSQKLELIGKCEFNHLINTLTIVSPYEQSQDKKFIR